MPCIFDIKKEDRHCQYCTATICDERQPKPKQEWSEEDEKMLKVAIELCEQCGNEYAYYWLKSLKERYTWKPSEYELKVLKLAAEKDGACLMGLYQQLKKLRGEIVMKANKSVDFFSIHSREEVAEIDKHIEKKQKEYDAELRDRMMKARDFPMTD